MSAIPPYTRGQLIAEALSQIGRTDLTANARMWLNLFLRKVYGRWDWEFLKRDSGFVALVDGGAVPANYRAMSTATLYYSSGGVMVPQRELLTMTSDEWAARKRIGTIASSQPRNFFISEDERKFYFWPQPDQNYLWQYYYYYMPTLPDSTDASTDTAVPLWPFDQEILIRAMQMKGLYFKDDERYQSEEKAIMDELQQVKFNSFDRRAGSNKLKLGKNFRRRY